MTHKVKIDICFYPNFLHNLYKHTTCNSGVFGSRRHMRRIMRKHFDIDAHHKSKESSTIIYLSPKDAITFKLKYN